MNAIKDFFAPLKPVVNLTPLGKLDTLVDEVFKDVPEEQKPQNVINWNSFVKPQFSYDPRTDIPSWQQVYAPARQDLISAGATAKEFVEKQAAKPDLYDMAIEAGVPQNVLPWWLQLNAFEAVASGIEAFEGVKQGIEDTGEAFQFAESKTEKGLNLAKIVLESMFAGPSVAFSTTTGGDEKLKDLAAAPFEAWNAGWDYAKTWLQETTENAANQALIDRAGPYIADKSWIEAQQALSKNIEDDRRILGTAVDVVNGAALLALGAKIKKGGEIIKEKITYEKDFVPRAELEKAYKEVQQIQQSIADGKPVVMPSRLVQVVARMSKTLKDGEKIAMEIKGGVEGSVLRTKKREFNGWAKDFISKWIVPEGRTPEMKLLVEATSNPRNYDLANKAMTPFFGENRMVNYTGGFRPSIRPGIEQAAPLPDTTMLAVHNLDASKLIFADKIGGLANPSLALFEPTKASFEGFGDITLVAPKDMVDPARINKGSVFAADAYSPRFPMSEFLMGYKMQDSVRESLKKYENVVGKEVSQLDLSDNPERQLENSSLMMAKFLESKGAKPNVITENGKTEGYSTLNSLREQIKEYDNGQEFIEFIETTLENVGAKREIFAGYTASGQRRYKELTAQEASKLMNKEAIKGGENFYYGLGSVRALILPKFKSIAEIQGAKDKIVTRQELDVEIEKNDKILKEILDELDQYATHKQDNPFSEFSTQSEVLAEYMAGKDRGFFKEKFKDVPSEILGRINDLKNVLKDMPTEYFEAKFKRPVSIGEFSFAVIPDNTSGKARDVLKKNNIPIIEYKAGDQISRRRALAQATQGKLPSTTLKTDKFAFLGGDKKITPQELFERSKKGEIPEDVYAQNRPTLRTQLQKTAKEAKQDLSLISAKALVPISSRLAAIDPILKRKVRKLEFDTNRAIQTSQMEAVPFLEGYSKMNDLDKSDLDLALKNRDIAKRDALLEANGLKDQYSKVSAELDNIYKQAEEAGFKLGYQTDYFPRKVKDAKGFLEYLHRDAETWSIVDAAIKLKEQEVERYLTPEEKADVANTLFRGYSKGKITLSETGHMKSRTVDYIDAGLNQFYQDSSAALVDYMREMHNAIEARKFFGKGQKNVQVDNLGDSIGAYTMQLVADNKITPAQEIELRDILQARFMPQGTRGFVSLYKNLEYIDTMGSLTSAVTQIGDYTYSVYRSGWKTAPALAKALQGKAKLGRKDIYLDLVAQEFVESGKSAKALETVFKYTGLTKMDILAKETFVSALLDDYLAKAKSPDKDTIARIKSFFGDDYEIVLRDLQAGEITENVKFLMFNELLEISPTALSEMPEKYLSGGNGRIVYMLKTYQLKLIDFYRNEIFAEIKRNPASGIWRLIKFASVLLLLNATADEIKDFILGRKTEFSDLVIDNLIRLTGFSKFTIYEARQQGLFSATAKMIFPPFKFLDAISKDAIQLIKTGFDKKKHVKDLKFETPASVPLVGKLYYWWFGKGADKKKKSLNI